MSDAKLPKGAALIKLGMYLLLARRSGGGVRFRYHPAGYDAAYGAGTADYDTDTAGNHVTYFTDELAKPPFNLDISKLDRKGWNDKLRRHLTELKALGEALLENPDFEDLGFTIEVTAGDEEDEHPGSGNGAGKGTGNGAGNGAGKGTGSGKGAGKHPGSAENARRAEAHDTRPKSFYIRNHDVTTGQPASIPGTRGNIGSTATFADGESSLEVLRNAVPLTSENNKKQSPEIKDDYFVTVTRRVWDIPSSGGEPREAGKTREDCLVLGYSKVGVYEYLWVFGDPDDEHPGRRTVLRYRVDRLRKVEKGRRWELTATEREQWINFREDTYTRDTFAMYGDKDRAINTDFLLNEDFLGVFIEFFGKPENGKNYVVRKVGEEQWGETGKAVLRASNVSVVPCDPFWAWLVRYYSDIRLDPQHSRYATLLSDFRAYVAQVLGCYVEP